MDGIIAFGEALKIKRKVGELENLNTETKDNTVAAINELDTKIKNLAEGEIVDIVYNVGVVDTEEVAVFNIPIVPKGIIKGIKCLAGYDAEDFYLSIYTKNPLDGGEYVYASGKVTTVLWDVMDIPFIDESEDNQLYCELYNTGVASSFTLKVYVLI